MISRHCIAFVSSLSVRAGALGLVLLASGVSRAQPTDQAMFRDLTQTLQARKLLLDDPQLGPLNLGVRVTNRIAVLWGPVPSQELSFRAEQRVRTMFELIEVRNRMTIVGRDDAAPAVPEAPRFLPDAVPITAPASRTPVWPAAQPASGVALAGIVTPDESITARSSPLGQARQAAAQLVTLRMPFLGSVVVPR